MSEKRQDLICILIRIPLAPRQEGNRLGGVGEEGGGEWWGTAETSEAATAQSRLEAGGWTWVAWWAGSSSQTLCSRVRDQEVFPKDGAGGVQERRGGGGALASLSSRCLLCAALPPQERQARPQAC